MSFPLRKLKQWHGDRELNLSVFLRFYQKSALLFSFCHASCFNTSLFSLSQPSTTLCHKGRCQDEVIWTFHQPPKQCQSQLSPPKTRPVKACAARTTKTTTPEIWTTSHRDRKRGKRDMNINSHFKQKQRLVLVCLASGYSLNV